MLTLLVSCLSLSGELTLGLVVPSFPWTFGPYQAQGLQLAVELSSRHGWKVYWLPVVESLPEGVYWTSDEAAATAPADATSRRDGEGASWWTPSPGELTR